MAFTRPTLAALVDQAQQDLKSGLGLVSPLLRRATAYVLARVIGAAAHMLHGHLEHLSQQVFPDLSDPDYLVRQAALFGLSLKPAAYASGTIDVENDSDGPASVIEDGTLLQRADGTEYVISPGVTVSGATVVPVTAVLPGADGNCDPGTALTFESPVAGVPAQATVRDPGISDGSDQESFDALRLRLLARLQQPPHGGAAFDYVAWALAVPGVTRAWCNPLESGPGTVAVRFMRDNDASPIPDSSEVAAVQAAINAVRPVTATVTVSAPVADAVPLSIHIVPDTPDIRAAVQAELADLFLRDAVPGGTIRHSRLVMAIGTADGVQDSALSVPAGDSTHGTGHIATLGTITWY